LLRHTTVTYKRIADAPPPLASGERIADAGHSTEAVGTDRRQIRSGKNFRDRCVGRVGKITRCPGIPS
jgi:hypothetical protein